MTEPKPQVLIFCCNPEESLMAELAAETRREYQEHEEHLDSVEFPETRCGICQEEDPDQALVVSGGVLMCSDCLDATLDDPELA
jgi:hypothetical protein